MANYADIIEIIRRLIFFECLECSRTEISGCLPAHQKAIRFQINLECFYVVPRHPLRERAVKRDGACYEREKLTAATTKLRLFVSEAHFEGIGRRKSIITPIAQMHVVRTAGLRYPDISQKFSGGTRR